MSPSGDHVREQFCSGSEALDRYFQTQASQDIKRRLAACFEAVGQDTQAVAGYYTLTATSVALSAFPMEIAKKLPRYPVVPAVLLARLAVIGSYQGQGLGGILLADALNRVSRAEFGVFALVVDAKDEVAQRFYEHRGQGSRRVSWRKSWKRITRQASVPAPRRFAQFVIWPGSSSYNKYLWN